MKSIQLVGCEQSNSPQVIFVLTLNRMRRWSMWRRWCCC